MTTKPKVEADIVGLQNQDMHNAASGTTSFILTTYYVYSAVEYRNPNAKLRKDEIPVDPKDVAQYNDEELSDDEDFGEAERNSDDEDFVLSDDETTRPVKSRENHKQVWHGAVAPCRHETWKDLDTRQLESMQPCLCDIMHAMQAGMGCSHDHAHACQIIPTR